MIGVGDKVRITNIYQAPRAILQIYPPIGYEDEIVKIINWTREDSKFYLKNWWIGYSDTYGGEIFFIDKEIEKI